MGGVGKIVGCWYFGVYWMRFGKLRASGCSSRDGRWKVEDGIVIIGGLPLKSILRMF
jgi:hypothetical protein